MGDVQIDVASKTNGETYRKTVNTDTSNKELDAAKSQVFDPDSSTIRQVIIDVHQQISQWRNGKFPNAKGLFVCPGGDTREGERYIKKLTDRVREITSCDVVSVSHKDRDAVGTINRFKTSRIPYIVAIGMISEGVNIPNLRAEGICRYIKSRMLFYQIAGRVMRMIKGEEDGTASLIVVPKFGVMEDYGIELDQQRKEMMRLIDERVCDKC